MAQGKVINNSKIQDDFQQTFQQIKNPTTFDNAQNKVEHRC